MGKAMMGTGEAAGDNRAIEAAEQAIANPLLDGISMRGARGVIISITGGEDMRLMEVDEAANHIKDLVDPDANIIWGSAFNNDLEGRIRVSVVATGIDVDTAHQPTPAKVFAFPTAVRPVEASKTPSFAPLDQGSSSVAPEMAEEPAAPAQAFGDEPEAAPGELELNEIASDEDDAELILDPGSMVAPDDLPLPPEDFSEEDDTNSLGTTRSWVSEEEVPSTPRREGGTLFERMSQFARGAAKAQVEEDNSATRDPLDIPRFLNRQNNQ
jgi:cell division protein FtsZ